MTFVRSAQGMKGAKVRIAPGLRQRSEGSFKPSWGPLAARQLSEEACQLAVKQSKGLEAERPKWIVTSPRS